ncbi:N-acetylneuraminate synthase [Marinicrinis sediminis]|uniref:N-acetylneuraminate synthase n=1 Tax=Marinicrinis sediminis TaxID=1652465 RepID=A0ABW5R912_9BACL
MSMYAEQMDQMWKGERTWIIAEVGVNHNGSLEMAKKLVDHAREAGADAVKFQMYESDQLVSDTAGLTGYQQERTTYDNQKQMLQQYQLNRTQFEELKQYCDASGILFLATPFDQQSAEALHNMGVQAFKIGSGDITHYPLLKQIGQYGKPMLLSTGMCGLGDIEDALHTLPADTPIVLLHCTSAYPAPYHDLHLSAIETMRSAFGHPVGYSDHSLGIEIPFAAVAMGYRVIEKHVTLDRNLAGPDHAASIEPAELKRMVQGIRHIEQALGSTRKQCRPSEQETRNKVRRGIYARRELKAGTVLQEADLLCLRPETDVPASAYPRVTGRTLQRSLSAQSPLSWTDLSEGRT